MAAQGDTQDAPKVLHGQCYCKNVKFEISDVKPIGHNFCHCQSCRTFHSAASVAAVMLPILIEDGKFSDNDGKFKITEGEKLLKVSHNPSSYVRRIFCQECGTPVLNSVPAMKVIAVFPSSFPAEELTFEPSYHGNYGDKLYPVRDGLPKYKGFKGMSELVDDDGQPIKSS